MDYQRENILNQQFINSVRNENLPSPIKKKSCTDLSLPKEKLWDLFHSQIISRQLDFMARKLKGKDQSYYTIGSFGHEGNVVFADKLELSDMSFLHYRSSAFMIQRLKERLPEDKIIENILLSFMASKNDPVAEGRHKVFGDFKLNVPPQTSTIGSHLPKAVGCALAITRAKELKIASHLQDNSLVFCSFGDASTHQAAALSAFNTASWLSYIRYKLPLIFLCEDNAWGISVATPKNWIETRFSNNNNFKYIQADGCNLLDLYEKSEYAFSFARDKRRPVFFHMKCVRILGHAGSDIESIYKSIEQIREEEEKDPLLYTAFHILNENYGNKEDILTLYKKIALKVEKILENMGPQTSLNNSKKIKEPLISQKRNKKSPPLVSHEKRKDALKIILQDETRKQSLATLLRTALADILLQYKNALVFGEDVGKKGGVYHVTAHLQKIFGGRRVFNTILDETSILGTAIGLAHNGFLPIAEIQYLAYLHTAIDQIRGEAASLSFFSSGKFTNPMLIRIASFAYQKGFGGHFHNENSFAALRDIPGLMIAAPSNGLDAVKMLRYCVDQTWKTGQIMIFLEPIALYHEKDLHSSGDQLWTFSYPKISEKTCWGELALYGPKKSKLIIISYANGLYLSLKAQKILKEELGIPTQVLDLRWLKPLPIEALIKATSHHKKILIVDECRKTGSVSEELLSQLYENHPKKIKVSRLTGEDSFISLGTSWKHLLPSKKSIIQAAKELNEQP